MFQEYTFLSYNLAAVFTQFVLHSLFYTVCFTHFHSRKDENLSVDSLGKSLTLIRTVHSVQTEFKHQSVVISFNC